MMEKTITEAIMGWCNESEEIGKFPSIVACKALGIADITPVKQERRLFRRIACEIDRCYTPNPRFGDGSPVSKGSEVDGGTVDFWTVYADGSWELYDADGNGLQHGAVDDRVKPPRPAIMSADGKVLEEGMTVWVTPEHREDCGKGYRKLEGVAGLSGYEYGDAVEVRNVVSADSVNLDTKGRAWCPASWLTTEPIVLDANGTELSVGETVWDVDSGDELVIVAILKPDCYKPVQVEFKSHPGRIAWLDQCRLTHREPDSLEKLRDDLMAAHESWDGDPNSLVGYADRLAALIDRGA